MLKLHKGLANYNADPRRARSRELDFGGWWSANGKPMEWPRFSVSWIERTGELYVWNSREDLYQVIGTFATEREVERAMEGWADPDSPIYHHLARLIEQVSRYPQSTPEQPAPDTHLEQDYEDRVSGFFGE